MSIFVRGFDFDTPESAIAEHFESIGKVASVELIGRNAALVHFDDSSVAQRAIDEKNESTISGNSRYINVRMDGDKGEGKGKKGGGKKGGKKGGKDYDGKGKGYGGSKGGGKYEDRTTFDGEFQQGTVAKWLNDRGFGYITPDSGAGDIFVHFSAVQGGGFKELSEGQRVQFGVEPDPKGKGKEGKGAANRAVAVSSI
eukprot:TRINITY_DN6160_c0_g1_i2.p2 TRINITY_DN6160_c0_g1~~TRINITY_DN6160_c0_g1_i2.p2  ORF type:complete len:198 (-),score=65.97 TRINITY_DN6160_c0_g1_i2:235-828(-)